MTPDDFDKLYLDCFPQIFSLCKIMVKNKQDAEELANDSFVKAYLNLSEFNAQKGSLRNLIYKIAVNSCLDFLKSKDYNKQKITQSMDGLEKEDEKQMLPDSQSEHQELIRFISECLKYLSGCEKVAITLYYIHGLTLIEIAQNFEKNSPNTAKKWIEDAKRKLKICLENKGLNEHWLDD